MPLIFTLTAFFEYKEDLGTYKKSFEQVKRRYSLTVLKSNMKGESLFVKLCLIVGVVLNYLSLILTPFFVICFIVYIML